MWHAQSPGKPHRSGSLGLQVFRTLSHVGSACDPREREHIRRVYMGSSLSTFLCDLEEEFLRECNITHVWVMGSGLGVLSSCFGLVLVGCPMCERGQLNQFKVGEAAACVATHLDEPGGTPSSNRRSPR